MSFFCQALKEVKLRDKFSLNLEWQCPSDLEMKPGPQRLRDGARSLHLVFDGLYVIVRSAAQKAQKEFRLKKF